MGKAKEEMIIMIPNIIKFKLVVTRAVSTKSYMFENRYVSDYFNSLETFICVYLSHNNII